MKKTLLLLTMVLSTVGSLPAQVKLIETLKPVSQKRYTSWTTKDDPFCIAIWGYSGGFKLSTGLGGLISSDNPGGHVEFNLGGAYDKISFVMGPGGSRYWGKDHTLNGPNSNGDGSNVIVTVTGDDETLLDEVVWNHDAPREVVLDVKGVKHLRFDVLRGTTDLAFGAVKLWKAGQKFTPATNPQKLPAGKVELVKTLWPYYYRQSGYIYPITDQDRGYGDKVKSISINRVEYTSGLQLSATQQLLGECNAWCYFWLQKKYEKISFIVGPRDNQSSNASGWVTVKADGKIIYEHRVTQKDLAEQVVLDVKGVNQLSFHSVDEHSDFLGGLTFGVVNIFAYPAGDPSVPTPGVVNGSQERISQLPDVCRMCKNIPPFSVRGVAKHNNTYYDGSSRHYTFSMGGEHFWEGFILTTGATLFDDNIDSYAAFDLAGEYDYITFTAGCLTQHRVLDDDILKVYADDKLILETTIHATWPNQKFELPLNKCRILKFVKPGNGQQARKQVYFGIGDVVLYRGKVVENKLFVHTKPDCPDHADLIDLCERPYFHYVGRYLSSLTNFDFNDCFKNGTSQREFFHMKDGTKIYKGIMLETNIPLGLEDVTLSQALFMFLTSAGGAISSSNVSAFTGVTAGAGGLAGGMGILSLVNEGGGQSSAAAFNPYGEYESVTFTVANKSEYVDPFDNIVGGVKQAPPVKLDIFADQVKVAEIMLTDKMQPTTYTVPINKCTQLMFWLECGSVRSGQYVLYNMFVDKEKLPQTPESLPKSVAETSSKKQSSAGEGAKAKDVKGSQITPANDKKDNKKEKETKKDKGKKKEKEKETVTWECKTMSGNKEMDKYLKAVTNVWEYTQEMISQSAVMYQISEQYLTALDGTMYKALSLVDARGNKLNIQEVIQANEDVKQKDAMVNLKIIDADLYLPSATLSVPSLGEKMFTFSKYIKLGPKATAQCRTRSAEIVEIKKMENEMLRGLIDSAVTVDGVASTDRTLLIPLPEGFQPPQGTSVQQLRYVTID